MVARAFLICLFHIFLLISSRACAGDVVVVLSERGGVYTEFAEFIHKSLEGSAWHLVAVVTPEALASDSKLKNADIWLTVGTEATRRGLPLAQSQTLIAALLPRNAFEQLWQEAGRPLPKGGLTAVVLDQPPGRHLHLIQLLLPRSKHVGVLIGTETRRGLASLQQNAQTLGLTLETEDINDDNAVVPAASRVLSRTDVLLAVPDSLVFSRHNIRPLLLASYRFQRPVIGYSAPFVTAGALAAIYSTPPQIARQVANLITSGRKPMPLIQFPDKFSLTYNRQVAQSLGLELPDEASVLRALEGKRDEP